MESLRKNFFELFSLPVSFAIDRAALDAAYRGVQAAVHPDRHAAAPEQQRRLAMQLATRANEGYQVLRDPARRAAYLCELGGVDLGTHSNTSMPAQFLMEQMEWRERLDDARAARDAAALEGLRGELDGRRREMLEAIGDEIDVRRDLAAAAGLVRQLMFLDKFGVEIDHAEESIA